MFVDRINDIRQDVTAFIQNISIDAPALLNLTIGG